MTHTRTHVYVGFANPFLTCDDCGQPVHSWHDNQECGLGCGLPAINRPCNHAAGVTSVCPSWGPVDGCQCLEHLGHVPHAAVPSVPQEDTDGR